MVLIDPAVTLAIIKENPVSCSIRWNEEDILDQDTLGLVREQFAAAGLPIEDFFKTGHKLRRTVYDLIKGLDMDEAPSTIGIVYAQAAWMRAVSEKFGVRLPDNVPDRLVMMHAPVDLAYATRVYHKRFIISKKRYEMGGTSSVLAQRTTELSLAIQAAKLSHAQQAAVLDAGPSNPPRAGLAKSNSVPTTPAGTKSAPVSTESVAAEASHVVTNVAVTGPVTVVAEAVALAAAEVEAAKSKGKAPVSVADEPAPCYRGPHSMYAIWNTLVGPDKRPVPHGVYPGLPPHKYGRFDVVIPRSRDWDVCWGTRASADFKTHFLSEPVEVNTYDLGQGYHKIVVSQRVGSTLGWGNATAVLETFELLTKWVRTMQDTNMDIPVDEFVHQAFQSVTEVRRDLY